MTEFKEGLRSVVWKINEITILPQTLWLREYQQINKNIYFHNKNQMKIPIIL